MFPAVVSVTAAGADLFKREEGRIGYELES